MSHLILIDKPEGMTSFSAVARVKRKLSQKRVGHTGTLDPMATGVLPILTGRASRLSSMMLESDKRYSATVKLGIVTDTYDITGSVLRKNAVNVTDGQFRDVCKAFLGTQKQLPPMYSAIKKDGVRLYELARRGESVERVARDIEIKEINVMGRISEDEYLIDVLCSKGTYIRSLAFDIGEKLGCGAALSALRRTAVSGFTIEDCTPLEEFINSDDGDFLKSPELCVMHLKFVGVSQAQANRFCHGGELDLGRLKDLPKLSAGEKLRVKFADEFLGIGLADTEKGVLKIGCIVKED